MKDPPITRRQLATVGLRATQIDRLVSGINIGDAPTSVAGRIECCLSAAQNVNLKRLNKPRINADTAVDIFLLAL